MAAELSVQTRKGASIPKVFEQGLIAEPLTCCAGDARKLSFSRAEGYTGLSGRPVFDAVASEHYATA